MDDKVSEFESGTQDEPVYGDEYPVEMDSNFRAADDINETAEMTLSDEDIDETANGSIIDYGAKENPENRGSLNPETTKSIVVFKEDPFGFGSYESTVESQDEISDTSDETSSRDNDDTMSLTQNETSENEFESRITEFEGRLKDLQTKVDEVLDSNGSLLSSFGNDLQTRAEKTELNRLKKDFDQFSRKLRRVVQAEDSVNAEALDATKVPPDVLEITYAKTLNDLYGAMLEIYGDRESSDMVENARENVRQFSAGVDFFRFEESKFVVRGLSDAIAAKIVSVKQIHGTYVELFKMLFQYVPNYNSQDFRAFVETGSREYTIEKVVSHEKHIEDILSDIETFRDELSHITENVSFMAELQNNQIEEMEGSSQELTDIKEQMKSIAKAVNLHTKALNKLNKTLIEIRDTPGPQNAAVPEKIVESVDMAKIEEMVISKASRDEIMAISVEMESFKANVESMFASIQQQLEENILSSQKLKGIENELSGMHEELQQIHVTEQPQAFRLADMPIEEVIMTQLSVLGPATLKQLEKQIMNEGFPIDFEKLSLVMSYLEQEELVNSVKKGRYTFYSVAGQ